MYACRQYTVNLVALSSDDRFPDSELSNTLTIDPGVHFDGGMVMQGDRDDVDGDDVMEDDLGLKVVRVTEATIHLDWSRYSEPQGLMYYRVVWSSVAQPSVGGDDNTNKLYLRKVIYSSYQGRSM